MGNSQSSSSDNVATSALVISVIALTTTVLQVLQQYLASAEGYRRCAPSVMGLWSKGTKRKFRQRELRFEVVFETPVLFIAKPDNERGPIPGAKIYVVDGSSDSYTATNTMKPKEQTVSNISTADDERASWVTLLAAIQKEEEDSRRWEETRRMTPRGRKYDQPEYTICHQMQKKTRSYDFMPPAVTKPYATTTISHLVEMAGMLGMFWKAFDHVSGNIRAEGNGYILTSTLVDGLGLMITFSITGPSTFQDNRIIPNYDIKELVFGLVPSILGKGRPLQVGDLNHVKKILTSWKCDVAMIDAYEARKDRSCMPSVTFELIAMLARPIRLRSSNLRMLPNPTSDRWLGSESVIDFIDEMEEFQKQVSDIIASLKERGVAVDTVLISIFDQWTKMEEVWSPAIDIDMREEIHNALDMITTHLTNHQFTTQIVASHLSTILADSDDLQSAVLSTADANPKGRLMRYYFAQILPRVMGDGLNLNEETKMKRSVVWIALMFRMVCWFLLHDFDRMDVNMMPSDMKGSRMPVFIG